ncbi:MAG TPA: type II secretion system F family protein [Acidimicrobiia bacterium]|nr:type II secretion system F family protein [Acidimicrobiia bacterium]
MVTSLVLAATVGGAFPLVPGMLLVLGWSHPHLALPLILVGSGLARGSARAGGEAELVTFHRVIASELRAGLSLRLALAAACSSVPGLDLGLAGRLAVAGRPLEEVARALSTNEELRPAAVALRVAGSTGGSVVGVFDALTAEAVDEEDLRREQRSLTVQARLSITIVGGFPLLILAFQVGSGEMGRLLELGVAGAVMVAMGVLLLLAGLVCVLFLLRRTWR